MQKINSKNTGYPKDFTASLPVDVQDTLIRLGDKFEKAQQAGDTDKFKAYRRGFMAIIDTYLEVFDEQEN